MYTQIIIIYSGSRQEANDLFGRRAILLHGVSNKSNLRNYNNDKLL